MATTKIVVPDFQFSGFYYAQILRRIRIFNRVNVPEITAEVAEEPFIQLERAFALVGHLTNCHVDLVANECLLPTAKLQDSVRRQLKLVDYRLKDYAPASVELLAELTAPLSSSQKVLEANAVFETDAVEDEDPVPFEVLESTVIGPTDVVDGAFAETTVRSGTGGSTVFGDPDAFEAPTLAASAADVNRIVQIEGSILGNNGTYRIVEVLTVGSPGKVRLTSALGGDDPLFIFETGLTWTIREFGANAATNVNAAGAPTWQPWAAPVPGDKYYLGSRYVMPTEVGFTHSVPGSGVTGVFEYYDPDLSDETPASVTNLGSSLRLDVTPLLGTPARTGAVIRVTYLPTGVYEDLTSTYVGGVNVVDTSAFLGQSGTPSTETGDYAVGADWNPFEGETDGTADHTADGNLSYTFPQTARTNWQKLDVEGVECFYMRYRVVSVVAPTGPTLDVVDLTVGSQFTLLDATQGETSTAEPLMSSNGQPNQTFELTTSPGLLATVEVYVDEGGGEVEWTNLSAEGKALLTSGPKDRHFEVTQNSLGVLGVVFGDGTRGRVPPLGVDNLRFVYRVNAAEDGNVGADTITVNAPGAALLASVTNPRAAFGWREAEGASPASLALVKEAGPASLRTLGRAVTPEDHEDLAVAFEASNGSRPVVRAKAIEEGFGVKTVKLVVVGANGVAISQSVKDELETYFNGNPATGEEGVGLINHEVTVVNFTPRVFGLTVTCEATAELTDALVRTTLTTLLSPTAVASNGTSFVWRFGGRVPLSRIEAEIFAASPGNVFDVDVTVPGADLGLAEDELPLVDVTSIGIGIVPPAV